MMKHLKARGLSSLEIKTIQGSTAKDKNNFARGFLGVERYKELRLKEFDLNQLGK